MTDRRQVLWIGEPYPPPPNVRLALGEGWELRHARDSDTLADQLQDVPLALVWPNGAAGNPQRLGALLDELEQSHAVAVFLLPEGATQAKAAIAKRNSPFLCLRQDSGAAELCAQLTAAADLQPAIKTLRQDRDKHAGETELIEQFDEEMRLAARLQRDFLPRRLPEVGGARFGVLYRPMSWVSGDIYDIARLDERHVGIYIVDAVGHGMPAALLTMFIKKALQTKRIVGNSYEIVSPEIALEQLNTDICEQNLTSCQFCTALYGILDTQDLTFTYSRAGHPEPILFRRDGSTRELDVKGSLLGVFPEERFESAKVQLQQGDRLIFYTDGAEEALRLPGARHELTLEQVMEPLALRPRADLLINLHNRIEANHEQGAVDDDVTIVVLDVER